MIEWAVFSFVLFVFAVVKDACLNRDSGVHAHLILGPGVVAAMAVTGCPLFGIVYVPYVFQVCLDWKYQID